MPTKKPSRPAADKPKAESAPQKAEEKAPEAPAAPQGTVIGPGVLKRPKREPGQVLPGDPPPNYTPSEQVFRRKK